MSLLCKQRSELIPSLLPKYLACGCQPNCCCKHHQPMMILWDVPICTDHVLGAIKTIILPACNCTSSTGVKYKTATNSPATCLQLMILVRTSSSSGSSIEWSSSPLHSTHRQQFVSYFNSTWSPPSLPSYRLGKLIWSQLPPLFACLLFHHNTSSQPFLKVLPTFWDLFFSQHSTFLSKYYSCSVAKSYLFSYMGQGRVRHIYHIDF